MFSDLNYIDIKININMSLKPLEPDDCLIKYDIEALLPEDDDFEKWKSVAYTRAITN